MYKRDIEGVEWYLEYELEDELRDRMDILELGVGLDNKGYLVFHEEDRDNILKEIRDVFPNFTEFDLKVLKAEGKVEFEGNIYCTQNCIVLGAFLNL